MKIKYRKSLMSIMTIIIIVLIFTGFTYQDKDSDDKIISDLMVERTRIMQKIMFNSDFNNEAMFESLSAVERHPLIEEDCEALKRYIDSDCDIVINMKVTNVKRTAKKANIIFYDVDAVWYMLGNSGHYTNDAQYTVRTITINGKTKLYGLENIMDSFL
ncbi:MAG: hypothetical protein HFE90_05665 [Firmicutes bacterium]|nr:hypothetical protein [Bacillota bacterium]